MPFTALEGRGGKSTAERRHFFLSTPQLEKLPLALSQACGRLKSPRVSRIARGFGGPQGPPLRLLGHPPRTKFPWSYFLLACLALGLGAPPPAAAHGDIHEQIAALTKRIAQDPKNATLYLKRGELYRVHREWDLALADYRRARVFDPALAAVDLCRGRMLLEADRPEPARLALERFVKRQPAHAEARVTLARILVKLGRRLPAAENFTRAIALSPEPKPEYFLERGQALAAEGSEHLEEALAGLDQGIEKLGPLVTLQLLAIELELRSKRTDAALARLEKIAAQTERQETWLARRGEILEQAGRPREAREAFTAALSALESLPPQRRQSKAMRELETRLCAAIGL